MSEHWKRHSAASARVQIANVCEMAKNMMLGMAVFLALLGTASAQYPGWQHSGSLCILTAPEGADLPAATVEENFPLLVRLDRGWFDFSQAKASGEDVRFATGAGTPLAYQIDAWDAAGGTAAIRVRIPRIQGGAQQEIKIFWGKADAKSESSGSAVFNASNGYLSVWHMDDPIKDEGTLYYSGTLSNAADSVFLKVHADDKLVRTESQTLKADKSYAFAVKLMAGLIRYKLEFGSKKGSVEAVLDTVTNLVCGDAFLIDGQSNAVAYNYHNETNNPLLTYTSPWIRSYGGNGEAGGDPTAGGWGNAVVQRLTPTSPDRIHFISVWGMALAKRLVEGQKIPICILNGAVGGTRIDQHLSDPINRYDTTDSAHSIYRNLLRRVVAAKLTHGIRGVLWHQGEADQGFDGPDNCYGCETYQQSFVDLSAAWKQDFPNIRHYYVYQIWPNACSQGGNRHSDMLRDVQRRLTRLYSNLSVMPTLDLPSGQSCHFVAEDYEKMGLCMAPLVERDSYGKVFDQPITAADLKKAYYTTAKKDEITLEFDQPVTWLDALTSQFYLDGQEGKVASGAASGNVITLKLAAPATAKTITYLVDRKWNPKALLHGKNGIAALTFCEVPLKPTETNL